MKDGEGCFTFLVVAVALILMLAVDVGIAESDLPDWVKFALLNR